MDNDHNESVLEKVKGMFNDIVGLPPGDGTPHGAGRPTQEADDPRGTLTSDDAENLPPHSGTGFKVE